jgi:hypothetical protein
MFPPVSATTPRSCWSEIYILCSTVKLPYKPQVWPERKSGAK